MPRNHCEYVAFVADGHGPVVEQVAAARRLLAAVVVPLRVVGPPFIQLLSVGPIRHDLLAFLL